jgi:hypothetical protein
MSLPKNMSWNTLKECINNKDVGRRVTELLMGYLMSVCKVQSSQ